MGRMLNGVWGQTESLRMVRISKRWAEQDTPGKETEGAKTGKWKQKASGSS